MLFLLENSVCLLDMDVDEIEVTMAETGSRGEADEPQECAVASELEEELFIQNKAQFEAENPIVEVVEETKGKEKTPVGKKKVTQRDVLRLQHEVLTMQK